MIQLSSRLIELLTAPVVESFYLVAVGSTKLTSYQTDLLIPGKGSFLATDMISAVDNLKATSVVDRDLYTISLVDSSFNNLPFYDNNLVGTNAEVYLGFVDYNTGLPELNHILLLYKGVVESFNYTVDTAEIGEVKSEIVCSNPMADLDAVRPFYTSKDFLRQLNTSDSAFDQVYQGSGVVNLLWGKA